MDVFFSGGMGNYMDGWEENPGIRALALSLHVQMNNGGQQKKKHAVIPIDGKCRQFVWRQLFFLSALFAKFPYTPTAWTLPCCSPTHTGQQEIGIQCFLDDFLKEMNPSQKMRTMNNGTAGLDVPDPSCSRKKKKKNSAHSREACMKKKVVITGLERAMARTIRVRGKQMGFCCAHTII